MKKFFSLAILAVFAFSFAHISTYTVDTSASTVAWVGKKVTGEHAGTVAIKSGKLLVNHGTLVGGSFVMDMTSIKCTDLEGEYAGKLEGHLKDDDFFGAEKYPTATFDITKAQPTKTKGVYTITGNMTIKEATKEVSFDATILPNEDRSITATGTIVIDRTEFDVRYGSGKFFDKLGDKTIYDDFELTVKLKASM